MTLSVLLLLFVLASLLAFLKCRQFSYMVHATWLVLFFLVGCGPIPQRLLQSLQAPYLEIPTIQWKTRNTIILLGGGNTQVAKHLPPEVGFFAQGRLTKTVELYRLCQQAATECKVIVSGGDPQGYGVSEALTYGVLLQALGVASQDLILEEQSMNTWQNAQFTQALLKNRPVDHRVLVSSGIHLHRSEIYFSHFGISVLPVRADYLRAFPSVLPLAYNFAMTDLALHEWLGWLRYHVYNYFGWNITATEPHAL